MRCDSVRWGQSLTTLTHTLLFSVFSANHSEFASPKQHHRVLSEIFNIYIHIQALT